MLYFLHGFTSLPVEWVDGTYDGLNLQWRRRMPIGLLRAHAAEVPSGVKLYVEFGSGDAVPSVVPAWPS